ncbi:hypothetical protein ACP4OV_025792 [Aristida adscensionis]
MQRARHLLLHALLILSPLALYDKSLDNVNTKAIFAEGSVEIKQD